MEKKKFKLSLTWQIVIGLILGIAAGFVLQLLGKPEIANDYIKPIGTIYLNLIKMIVVPVVTLSIIQGVISLRDIRKVGTIGGRTVLYFLCTTAVAVLIGLVFANLLKVGGGYTLPAGDVAYEAKEAPPFMDTIVNIFPSNIIAPFANATMLQVIVVALFFGFGIILVGEKGKKAAEVVDSFAEVSFKIMEIVIKLSGIGVFALITPVVAAQGLQVLLPLLRLILVCYLCYVLHSLITYTSTVMVFGKVSPLKFFKEMFRPIIFAFSSASSVGALPLNIEANERMGVRKEVASFVLPLGATINMDGTAIYQGVCAIFIAQVYGIDLTIGQQLTIVLTAVLASIGTAGVPGSGMIMLAMVLQSVGLPVDGIALVAGIDRILDMGRTTVNITGDAACSVCVNRWETKREERLAAKAAKKAAKEQ